jgi:hypothetical protein
MARAFNEEVSCRQRFSGCVSLRIGDVNLGVWFSVCFDIVPSGGSACQYREHHGRSIHGFPCHLLAQHEP